MYEGALHYIERTKLLGLMRLSTLIGHMAKSVNQSIGNSNKTLYLQYYRSLTITLNESKAALQKFAEENKEALQKNEAPAEFKESTFRVPERKDSDEKVPTRRLSDLQDVKVINLGDGSAPSEKPALKKRDLKFDMSPLPDKFNFVDKIKAPYELPKTS